MILITYNINYFFYSSKISYLDYIILITLFNLIKMSNKSVTYP